MLFIYIYIYASVFRAGVHVTGVCEKNTPFRRALALQSFGRNCYGAPDLVLRKPIFLIALFSGGVFFSQTPGALHISNLLNEAKSGHISL